MMKKPTSIIKGQLNKTHGTSTSRKYLDGSNCTDQRTSVDREEPHSMSSIDRICPSGFRSACQFKSQEIELGFVEKLIDKRVNEMSLFMSKTYSDAILTLKDSVKKLNGKFAGLSSQVMSSLPLIEQCMAESSKAFQASESLKCQVETQFAHVDSQIGALQGEFTNQIDQQHESVASLRIEIDALKEKVKVKDSKIKALKEKAESADKRREKVQERLQEEIGRTKQEKEMSKELSAVLASIQLRVASIESQLSVLLPLKTQTRHLDFKLGALTKDQEVIFLRLEDIGLKIFDIKRQIGDNPKHKKARSITPQTDKHKAVPAITIKTASNLVVGERLETLNSKIDTSIRYLKNFEKIWNSARRKNKGPEAKFVQRKQSLPTIDKATDEMDFPSIVPDPKLSSKEEAQAIEVPQEDNSDRPSKQVSKAQNIKSAFTGINHGTPKCASVQSVSVTFLVDDDNFLRDKTGNYLIDDFGEKVQISENELLGLDAG